MPHRVKMLFWIVAWFVLFFVQGGWEQTAYATIIVFTDPQSFFQAAKIVSTETFDELPSRTIIGVGSVTLDGIAYTSADPLAQWGTYDSFVTPSPPNGLIQSNVVEAKLTFAAGGHTDAIGFFLVPGSSRGDYRFNVATASGETLTVSSDIIGETIFRGFISSDDIRNGIDFLSITPLELGAGGFTNFELDNVSRGAIVTAIPEPPTLVLWTTGILVLFAYILRQRTQPATSRA